MSAPRCCGTGCLRLPSRSVFPSRIFWTQGTRKLGQNRIKGPICFQNRWYQLVSIAISCYYVFALVIFPWRRTPLMKNLVSLFILLSLVVVMVPACGTMGKTAKPSSETASPATAGSGSGKIDEGNLDKLPPQRSQDKRSASSEHARSGLPDKSVALPEADGMALRPEVNQAALEFAKNFPDVKAVKTCYFTAYGTWNLDLFVGKGKKIDKQQFAWNNKTKEWEPTAKLPVENPDRLEYLLDTQLGDEKCFVLKR